MFLGSYQTFLRYFLREYLTGKSCQSFSRKNCVIHFTEYLTNHFSSGNPRKKKKLKALILRFYMKLSLAKLLNNHEATVTNSIKERSTAMIKHSNSQITIVFFNLICQNKLLLCYCDVYMNECCLELLRYLIIISHRHGTEQTSLEQSKTIID